MRKGTSSSPPVLLKDGDEVPLLQLAQHAADRARAVPPLVAADERGCIVRVEDDPERLEDRLLRQWVIRRRIVVGAEVMQRNAVLLEKALAVCPRPRG